MSAIVAANSIWQVEKRRHCHLVYEDLSFSTDSFFGAALGELQCRLRSVEDGGTSARTVGKSLTMHLCAPLSPGGK